MYMYIHERSLTPISVLKAGHVEHLQQNSDNELPHDNSDSGDGREVSGSSKAKRRRVDKHSTGCDSAWVRRWEWLRPVCSHTVMGLICHLCQKHETIARNGSIKWSR